MMVEFIQEVKHTFDKETSLYLWKINFWAMDFILLAIIPLAIIADFCCGTTAE